MVSILTLVLWTVVAIRIVALRATLTVRTLATTSLLGALLGIMGAPFVRALAAPYGERGPYIDEMASLGIEVVLLLPVLYLFLRGAHKGSSVADSFLMAFALGFGFDLAGALLVGGAATTPLKGLAFLPPWQIDLEKASVAGYGYWSGLVALGIAAALRFGRKLYLAVAVGIVTLFWVVTEHAALLSPIQEKPDNWIAGFGNLTLHGALTASIALLALVGLSIWEVFWAAPKSDAGFRAKFHLLEHLKLLLPALAGRKIKEVSRLIALFRCQRQAALAQAELIRLPDDAEAARLVRQLDQKIQELDRGPREATAPAAPAAPFWRSRRLVQAVVWVILAAVVLFPDTVGKFFWSLPVLHFQFTGLPTILIGALMIAIIWCFLAAAGGPVFPADADSVVQFLEERAILRISLLAVLIVLFFSPVDALYPFPSVVADFTGSSLPGFTPADKDSASHSIQLATVLLLFACAACSFSLASAACWRRAPISERRRTALRNTLSLAGASVGIWVCLAVYKDVVGWSHHLFGAIFFKVQRWFSLKETFGVTGNTVGAMTAAFVMCLLCLAGLALHRVLSDRLESFFIGEQVAQPSLRATGHSQGA